MRHLCKSNVSLVIVIYHCLKGKYSYQSRPEVWDPVYNVFPPTFPAEYQSPSGRYSSDPESFTTVGTALSSYKMTPVGFLLL